MGGPFVQDNYMGAVYSPFHETISTRLGFKASICSHRRVGRFSQMKTQFLVLKCVENHGDTAIRLFSSLTKAIR